MGVAKYKTSFTCDCSDGYGTCGKKSFFLLEYNRSVDIGSLFYKEHSEDPDSKLKFLGCFTDTGINALVEVLTQSEPKENLTPEELEELNSVRYGK